MPNEKNEREDKVTEPNPAIFKKSPLSWVKTHIGALCAVFSIIIVILIGSYGYWYLIKSNERLSALTLQSQNQLQQLQFNVNNVSNAQKTMQKFMNDFMNDLSQFKQSINTTSTSALPATLVPPNNSLDQSPAFAQKTKRAVIFFLGMILFLFYFISLLFSNIAYFFRYLSHYLIHCLHWQYKNRSYSPSIDPIADWKNLLKILPDLYQSESLTNTQLSLLEKKMRSEFIKETAYHHPEKSEKIVGLINQSLKKYWDADLVRLYGLLITKKPIKQLAQAEHWLTIYPDQALLFLTLGRLSLRCQLWGKAHHYFEMSLKLNKDAKTCLEHEKLLEKLSDSTAATLVYRDGLLS